MEQTTSGVHSSTNYLLHSLQQQQQSEILLPNNNNSNNNKNNNPCYSAMNLTVLDRQRDRLNALQLNWQQQQQDQCLNTNSEQMHGSFFNLPRSSSEMFQNNIITSDWQQAAAQNGSLMPTNRMGDENFTILSDGSAPREMVCRSLCSAVPLQQQHRLQNAAKLENVWPDLSNDEDNNNTSLIKIDGSAGSIGRFTATSCLAPFSSDPGFAERAAKFSSFNNGNAILTNAQRLSTEESAPRAGVSNESEAAKTVCRAASCPSALEDVTDDAQRFSNFAEESVLSEKTSVVDAKFANGNAVKKRKTDRNHGTNLQNIKGADSDEIKEKRSKTVDVRVKEKEDLKGGQGNSDNSGESNPKMIKENAKASETQKHDYIHVRARRGQATDSHSLAERVRREKISERMKYLQDLVPGCHKVTGKAVMLDEIINYVQSLQRQVEFLSMKLAAVNPSFDFNIDNLFAKEMIIPCGNFPSMEVSPDPTESYYIQFHQLQQASFHTVACSGLDVPSSVVSSPDTSSLRRTNSAAGPTELFVDTNFQGHAPSSWDGELQNVISMVQGRESPFASQGLPGLLEVNPTKIEM